MAATTEASPTLGAARRRRFTAPLIALAVLGVQAVFVLCFAYPMLHAAPHRLPIGVAGPASATAPVGEHLDQRGDAFSVHRYADANAARTAIREREIYGAVVLTRAGPSLLVANAASPAVADQLTKLATGLGHGASVPVTDVVPGAPGDPNGVGLFATLLPLIMTSVVGGYVIYLVERRRSRQLPSVAGFAVLAGLATAGLAEWLGAVDGHYAAASGVYALIVAAAAVSTLGLSRLIGRAGIAVMAPLMIFLGIPAAGAQLPVEFLAQPWRALGPILPPGAGTDLLRGAMFFDGAAVTMPLCVLGAWTVLGLALVAFPYPRRRPA